MRYPKPQKGNPHKLTIDQHIFPKACISRFTGENGTAQVRRKSGEQDLWLTPQNSYFCARRLWDQKAEAVFMKAIEDRYQDVASNILAGAVTTLDAATTEAVADLYLLWTLRHERYRAWPGGRWAPWLDRETPVRYATGPAPPDAAAGC